MGMKIWGDLKIIIGFFIFPIGILIEHVFLLLFGVYRVFPWFDIPIHFIGGSSIGITYFLILEHLQKKDYIRIGQFIRIVFVLSLVALTAVSWEFFEFSATYLTGLGLQGGLNDTMFDLFLGIFGGISAVILLEAIIPKDASELK